MENTKMSNPYHLSRRDVRRIVRESGISSAEFCVNQAETQCRVAAARDELNKIWAAQCRDDIDS